MEESQRQNIVSAFNNVMRTSSLVGVVDLQRTGMAFSSLLESCTPGEAIPLGPLFDFLIEQKAPPAAATEVVVFLKSRESRFGVVMDLPPSLQALSPEEQQQIVSTFAQRGPGSGTFTRPPPAQPPPASTPKTAEPKRVRGMPTRNKLIVVAALSGLGLLANLIYNVATAEPPPAPLTLNDPAGLPCAKAIGSKGVATCHVPAAFFSSNAPAVVKARAEVTKSAARAQGFNKLLVFSVEDSKFRFSP